MLFWSLSWQAWLSLGVVFGIFGLLTFTKLSADYAFLGGLGVLLLFNVLSPQEALSGFSSPGVVTVGVLYIVVCGLRETGGLMWIVRTVLGRPAGVRRAQLRLMLPVAGLSAFLNNTPVVALFIPVVMEWSKRINIPASRLLIPLSYASIFGGICTLIGTSTNLVVNALVQNRYHNTGLSMFEITKIGLPCAIAGMIFITLFRRLLPDRQDKPDKQDGPDNSDSALISVLTDKTPGRSKKAWPAFIILALMVVAAAFNWLSMLKAAVLAAGLMLVLGCCSGEQARRSLEWPVLLTIAAALGLGLALEKTGAAQSIAGGLLGLTGAHVWGSLAMVYLVTTVFTEVITNNAAAALVFPVAMNTAELLGVSPMPFIMCIMVGASASFATPIGYQTNLMVYGPGGYRFSDYIRIGLPLNLLIGLVCVLLAPFIWPFQIP
jgi:di/tricarboxylate transporter